MRRFPRKFICASVPRWRALLTRPARRAAAPLLVVGVAALLGYPGSASGEAGTTEEPPVSATSCRPFDHDHPEWGRILANHVRDGSVDYRALHRSRAPDLAAYLGSLERVCRGDYDRWSRKQRLALWINAYNGYTIRLVLDHYPVASIRKIGTIPGSAFDRRFIRLPWYRSGPLSLNDIEHRILRKELREPRIHFAVVCASKDCPRLQPAPYVAERLDAQLEAAARQFIRDPARNRFEASTRTLYLSALFDWFGEDFTSKKSELPAYIARYAEESTARELRKGGVRVKFLDYDWSLNGR